MKAFFAGNLDKISWNPQTLVLEARVKKKSEQDILVGTDTGSFKSFRRQLFVLVRHHMDAQRELIHIGTFAAQIENANFWIGDTTVEAWFRIWLDWIAQLTSRASDMRFIWAIGCRKMIEGRGVLPPLCPSQGHLTYLVFAVAITSCRTTSHRGAGKDDRYSACREESWFTRWRIEEVK